MRFLYPTLLMGLFLIGGYPCIGGSSFRLDKDLEEFPFEVNSKLIMIKATVDGLNGWFLLDTGVDELTLNLETDIEAAPLRLHASQVCRLED